MTRSKDTLATALATQRLHYDVTEMYEASLLQARRDGWSLREIGEHLNLSYSSVKRHAERALAREEGRRERRTGTSG